LAEVKLSAREELEKKIGGDVCPYLENDMRKYRMEVQHNFIKKIVG